MLKSHNPIKINSLLQSALLIVFLALQWGCENDIQKIKELTAKQDSAIVSIKNVETIYTTKGINNVLLKAPLLNQYIKDKQKSIIEFPEGISIVFYDEKGEISSTIKADYSIYYEDEGKWIARYNVVAVNEKGETLNTEYLVWLKNEATISSDQFVKVSSATDTLYGDGLKSDQTFSAWEIINPQAYFYITTDE